MLSRALQRPIEVYMLTPEATRVQVYGGEMRTKMIRVLFHPCGHYAAMAQVEDGEAAFTR